VLFLQLSPWVAFLPELPLLKGAKTRGPEFKLFAAKIRNCHNFGLKPLLIMADLYVYFEKEPISNSSRGPEKTPNWARNFTISGGHQPDNTSHGVVSNKLATQVQRGRSKTYQTGESDEPSSNAAGK
jgi:hypothetical protein